MATKKPAAHRSSRTLARRPRHPRRKQRTRRPGRLLGRTPPGLKPAEPSPQLRNAAPTPCHQGRHPTEIRPSGIIDLRISARSCGDHHPLRRSPSAALRISASIRPAHSHVCGDAEVRRWFSPPPATATPHEPHGQHGITASRHHGASSTSRSSPNGGTT